MTLDNTLINIEKLTTKQVNKVIARLEAMNIIVFCLKNYHRNYKKFIQIHNNRAYWSGYDSDQYKILSYEEFLKIPVTWVQSNTHKEKAWEILEKYNWTQNAGSRDKYGKPCEILSEEAASFCLIGVCSRKNKVIPGVENIDNLNDIKKVAEVITKRVPHILEDHNIGSGQYFNIVFKWNDDFCESKEEAIEVLKAANV